VSRITRLRACSHALLLVAAFAAAVPAVRWCPRTWDEIAPEQFLRCAAVSSVGHPGCALTYAGAVPASAPACAHGDRCTAAATCSACPLGEHAAPAPRPAAPHRGRAYLLGDAAAMRALRYEAPRLAPAAPAIVVLAASLPAPPAARARVADLACTRPPPDTPHAPPPARAPPLDA
jgi:hypothetical protein